MSRWQLVLFWVIELPNYFDSPTFTPQINIYNEKTQFFDDEFLVILSSCSSDDDSSKNASIVGKWTFDTTIINNGIPIPYDDHEVCGKDYLEFKSDNTFVEIDVWDCELDVVDYGTYSKTNNQLMIMSEGETYLAEIIELTNSKLKIKMEFDDNGDGINDNILTSCDRI